MQLGDDQDDDLPRAIEFVMDLFRGGVRVGTPRTVLTARRRYRGRGGGRGRFPSWADSFQPPALRRRPVRGSLADEREPCSILDIALPVADSHAAPVRDG